MPTLRETAGPAQLPAQGHSCSITREARGRDQVRRDERERADEWLRDRLPRRAQRADADADDAQSHREEWSVSADSESGRRDTGDGHLAQIATHAERPRAGGAYFAGEARMRCGCSWPASPGDPHRHVSQPLSPREQTQARRPRPEGECGRVYRSVSVDDGVGTTGVSSTQEGEGGCSGCPPHAHFCGSPTCLGGVSSLG